MSNNLKKGGYCFGCFLVHPIQPKRCKTTMVNIFKSRKSADLADALQNQARKACDRPIITEKEARKLLRKETSEAIKSIDLMRTIGYMAYLSDALLDGAKVPQNGKDMVK